MKYLLLLILFLTTGLTQAQDSLEVETFSSTLYLGEAMQFGDKSIKFKKLISDSRCPRNVTCIWAGEAEILVEVYQDGELCGTEILTVAAGQQLPAFLQDLFPKQMISLTSLVLAPYPEAPGDLKPEDYQLNLEVSVTRENTQ